MAVKILTLNVKTGKTEAPIGALACDVSDEEAPEQGLHSTTTWQPGTSQVLSGLLLLLLLSVPSSSLWPLLRMFSAYCSMLGICALLALRLRRRYLSPSV